MSFIQLPIRHKKKRDCTIASSTFRGCRIALEFRTDNAKPTPNIKYSLCYFTINYIVRVCAYAHAREMYQH